MPSFVFPVVYLKPPAPSKVSLFVSILGGHAQSQTWPLTPALDTDTLSGGWTSIVVLSACSLIMHNAIADVLRPCPSRTQSCGLCSLSVKKHLAPGSEASEDAVTFPKEIPFPRKQFWHWHGCWLASCDGIPHNGPVEDTEMGLKEWSSHSWLCWQVVLKDLETFRSYAAEGLACWLTQNVNIQQNVLTRRRKHPVSTGSC